MYLFWHILVHFERVWQCLGTRLSKCFMVILVGNNSGKVAVAWKEVKKVGHEQHRQLWAKRRACRRVAYERALPMRLKAPRDRRTACAAFSAKICIKYRKHGCYSSMLVNFLVRTRAGIFIEKYFRYYWTSVLEFFSVFGNIENFGIDIFGIQ